jgi:hypothetical protein
MSKELTDAEIAVADFMRFRDEVRQAGLNIDNDGIVQLMVARNLNGLRQSVEIACNALADIRNHFVH